MHAVTRCLSSFLAEQYLGHATSHPATSVRIRLDNPAIQNGKAQFFSVVLEFPSPPASNLRLTLENLPWDHDVESAAADLYGHWSETDRGRRLSLIISDECHPKLRRLAQAIKRVISRGKRYADPNWKWTAPAIANTLVKLTDNVRDYRRTR